MPPLRLHDLLIKARLHVITTPCTHVSMFTRFLFKNKYPDNRKKKWRTRAITLEEIGLLRTDLIPIPLTRRLRATIAEEISPLRTDLNLIPLTRRPRVATSKEIGPLKIDLIPTQLLGSVRSFIIPSKLWVRVVTATEDLPRLLRKLADRRTQISESLFEIIAKKHYHIRSMEGFLDQDDKECISVKKVIMKQEETFRHQVQELHRVYRIQKLLMRDAQPNCKFLRQTNQTSSGKGTPEHYKEPKLDPDEESSDLELTLATGSSRCQWKKRSASYNSHSGSSFSSTSVESERRKLKNNDWVVPQDFGRFGGKRKSAGLKIEKMRQHELKQPSWLFLCNKQHSMVTSLGL